MGLDDLLSSIEKLNKSGNLDKICKAIHKIINQLF